MALSNFFHNNIASRRLLRFELRPEDEYIFLRGTERETPDYTFKGHVVVMTSEPIQLKSLKVQFIGKRRTMHFITSEADRPPGIASHNPILNKGTVFEKTVEVRDRHGQEVKTLKPGNWEFPFEFVLPGNISESIEGLPGSSITYTLNAHADRGVLAKDLHSTKHVRIIRTLGDDPVELVDPQDVNGLWPDKLKYQFSTSSRAAIYGTKIITEVHFTPLIEKLKIGKIHISLKETQKIKTIPGPDFTPGEGYHGMWKHVRDVSDMWMEVPENSEDEDPELHLPMFKFQIAFPLPKSLTKCRQSVENSEWIKIKHQLNFDVLLHNPDGHLSELRAHHGVRLFISPNLPLEGDAVPNTHAEVAINGTSLLTDLQTAPPDYTRHQLDPLYNGIDPSGFMTPAFRSGAHTPGYRFSRSGSSENLASLNQAADQPFPQELRDRLSNLQAATANDAELSRRLYGTHVNGDHSPPSGPSSGMPSRSNSIFDIATMSRNPAPTSEIIQDNIGYDMTALERMPSYETATRTPLRTPFQETPPTYEVATSRPPSPILASPLAAHLGYRLSQGPPR